MMPALSSRYDRPTTSSRTQASSNDHSWGYDRNIRNPREPEVRHDSENHGYESFSRRAKIGRKPYVTKGRRPDLQTRSERAKSDSSEKWREAELCRKLREDILTSVRTSDTVSVSKRESKPPRTLDGRRKKYSSDYRNTRGEIYSDMVRNKDVMDGRYLSSNDDDMEDRTLYGVSDPWESTWKRQFSLVKDIEDQISTLKNNFVSPNVSPVKSEARSTEYQNIRPSRILAEQVDTSVSRGGRQIMNDSARIVFKNESQIVENLSKRDPNNDYNLKEIILHYELDNNNSHAATKPVKNSTVASYPEWEASIRGSSFPRNSTPIGGAAKQSQTKRKKVNFPSSKQLHNDSSNKEFLRDQRYWYRKVRECRGLLSMEISSELREYTEQSYFFAVEQLVSRWRENHEGVTRNDKQGKERPYGGRNYSFYSQESEVLSGDDHKTYKISEKYGRGQKLASFKTVFEFDESSSGDEFAPYSFRAKKDNYMTHISAEKAEGRDRSSRHGLKSKELYQERSKRRLLMPSRSREISSHSLPSKFDLARSSGADESELSADSFDHSRDPNFTHPFRIASRKQQQQQQSNMHPPAKPAPSGNSKHPNGQPETKSSKDTFNKDRLLFLAQLAQLEQKLRQSKRDLKKKLLAESSSRERAFIEEHYMDTCDELCMVEDHMKRVVSELGLDELKVRNIINSQLEAGDEDRDASRYHRLLPRHSRGTREASTYEHEYESGIGSANQSLDANGLQEAAAAGQRRLEMHNHLSHKGKDGSESDDRLDAVEEEKSVKQGSEIQKELLDLKNNILSLEQHYETFVGKQREHEEKLNKLSESSSSEKTRIIRMSQSSLLQTDVPPSEVITLQHESLLMEEDGRTTGTHNDNVEEGRTEFTDYGPLYLDANAGSESTTVRRNELPQEVPGSTSSEQLLQSLRNQRLKYFNQQDSSSNRPTDSKPDSRQQKSKSARNLKLSHEMGQRTNNYENRDKLQDENGGRLLTDPKEIDREERRQSNREPYLKPSVSQEVRGNITEVTPNSASSSHSQRRDKRIIGSRFSDNIDENVKEGTLDVEPNEIDSAVTLESYMMKKPHQSPTVEKEAGAASGITCNLDQEKPESNLDRDIYVSNGTPNDGVQSEFQEAETGSNLGSMSDTKTAGDIATNLTVDVLKNDAQEKGYVAESVSRAELPDLATPVNLDFDLNLELGNVDAERDSSSQEEEQELRILPDESAVPDNLASFEQVSFDESITDLLSVEELELLETLDEVTLKQELEAVSKEMENVIGTEENGTDALGVVCIEVQKTQALNDIDGNEKLGEAYDTSDRSLQRGDAFDSVDYDDDDEDSVQETSSSDNLLGKEASVQAHFMESESIEDIPDFKANEDALVSELPQSDLTKDRISLNGNDPVNSSAKEGLLPVGYEIDDIVLRNDELEQVEFCDDTLPLEALGDDISVGDEFEENEIVAEETKATSTEVEHHQLLDEAISIDVKVDGPLISDDVPQEDDVDEDAETGLGIKADEVVSSADAYNTNEGNSNDREADLLPQGTIITDALPGGGGLKADLGDSEKPQGSSEDDAILDAFDYETEREEVEQGDNIMEKAETISKDMNDARLSNDRDIKESVFGDVEVEGTKFSEDAPKELALIANFEGGIDEYDDGVGEADIIGDGVNGIGESGADVEDIVDGDEQLGEGQYYIKGEDDAELDNQLQKPFNYTNALDDIPGHLEDAEIYDKPSVDELDGVGEFDIGMEQLPDDLDDADLGEFTLDEIAFEDTEVPQEADEAIYVSQLDKGVEDVCSSNQVLNEMYHDDNDQDEVAYNKERVSVSEEVTEHGDNKTSEEVAQNESEKVVFDMTLKETGDDKDTFETDDLCHKGEEAPDDVVFEVNRGDGKQLGEDLPCSIENIDQGHDEILQTDVEDKTKVEDDDKIIERFVGEDVLVKASYHEEVLEEAINLNGKVDEEVRNIQPKEDDVVLKVDRGDGKHVGEELPCSIENIDEGHDRVLQTDVEDKINVEDDDDEIIERFVGEDILVNTSSNKEVLEEAINLNDRVDEESSNIEPKEDAPLNVDKQDHIVSGKTLFGEPGVLEQGRNSSLSPYLLEECGEDDEFILEDENSGSYVRSLSLTSWEEDDGTDIDENERLLLNLEGYDAEKLDQNKEVEMGRNSDVQSLKEGLMPRFEDFQLKGFENDGDSEEEKEEFMESFGSLDTMIDEDISVDLDKSTDIFSEDDILDQLDHLEEKARLPLDTVGSLSDKEDNTECAIEDQVDIFEINSRDMEGSENTQERPGSCSPVRQIWVYRQMKTPDKNDSTGGDYVTSVHEDSPKLDVSDAQIASDPTRQYRLPEDTADANSMGNNDTTVDKSTNLDYDSVLVDPNLQKEGTGIDEDTAVAAKANTNERIVIGHDRLYTISEATIEDNDLSVASILTDPFSEEVNFSSEDEISILDFDLGDNWSPKLNRKSDPHSLERSNSAMDAEDIKRWLTMLIEEESEIGEKLESIDVEEIEQILLRAQSEADTESIASHGESPSNLVTFEYIRKLWQSRKSLRMIAAGGDNSKDYVTLEYLKDLFSSQQGDDKASLTVKERKNEEIRTIYDAGVSSTPSDNGQQSVKSDYEGYIDSEISSISSFSGREDLDVVDGAKYGDYLAMKETKDVDENENLISQNVGVPVLDKTRKEGSSSCEDNTSGSRSNHPNDMDHATPIVLDNGSGMMKAGLADGIRPSVVSPNVVGRPNYKAVIADNSHKKNYVGHEADAYRGILRLSYPIQHGVVTDWNDMERIWEHVFMNELRVEPEDHPVLTTEAPLNPKKNREKMIEIMMEVFNVPAFYVAIQAVLALYSSGRTTGVVVDSGDGVSHIVPVSEGYAFPHASERINIAGRDITQYLMKILMEKGYNFRTTAEQEICRCMKEELCFIAEDYDKAMEESAQSNKYDDLYMLPDGRTVTVSDERFRAAEILFDPNLIGLDIDGIHTQLYKSIQRCDMDIRSELYRNIILSGGTTMLPGIDHRLHRELTRLRPNKDGSSIKVVASDERKFSVWCGGAALASHSTFNTMWVSSEEYFEIGVDAVHLKCF